MRGTLDLLKNGDEDAPDWTCTIGYNSEQMLGVVNAATFFVESNGAFDLRIVADNAQAPK